MSKLRVLQIQTCLQVYAAHAVMVTFFQSIGLSQNHLSLSQLIFTVILFVAYPICGWIADRYSRPKCIAIGCLLTAAAFLWHGLATSLLEVLVIEVLLGIGGPLYYCASASLVPTYAKSEGKDVDKAYIRLVTAGSISTAVLTAVGGWLGSSHPQYALLLTAGLYAVAGGLALALREVRESSNSQLKLSEVAARLLGDIKAGAKAAYSSTRLRWTIVAGGVGCQIGRGLLWVQSALYAQSGVPAELIGLAWTLFLLPIFVGSHILEYFVERWSVTTLLLVPGLSSVGAMAVMAIAPSPWTIGLIAVVGLTGGWLGALFPVLIQREANPKELAFVKALGQNFNIVLYVLVTFMVGWAATADPQLGVAVNVAIFLPLLLVCVWKLSTIAKRQGV